ncbi:MAG: TrmH family RNA methyltransferase [Chlamydiota bacterium]
MYPLIESSQNPRIKMIGKLRTKRQRDHTQRFLIEGYRELACAQEAGVPIEELFFSPAHFLGANENDLIETLRKSGVKVYEVRSHLFDKLSYRDRGDGLLAVAKQTHRTLGDLVDLSILGKFKLTSSLASSETEKLNGRNRIEKSMHPPFFLIAEAIEKPGNLGSMLRSADAAGVDALILCDSCTDIHNPNVVRASVGTLFTVPIVETTTVQAIEAFREWGVCIVASTPGAAESFTQANLTGPIGIAVGTEQLGLSDTWLKQADIQVKIPMHGRCNSLNVAAATTLFLYEVVRQRAELSKESSRGTP